MQEYNYYRYDMGIKLGLMGIEFGKFSKELDIAI